jgi:hypothetical protein
VRYPLPELDDLIKTLSDQALAELFEKTLQELSDMPSPQPEGVVGIFAKRLRLAKMS